ncbi:MAG: hypothetical protein UV80_C0007G0066 [Candidatus Peregrinibacteria bacterium GW2011_GWF2_43_17]|nr:MAG: hypothetical protein UV80_C0007G0066 [Candidatus Peregrinibacteria bacterium GW2011_GWF2_43_17]KKT19200.1 MAG: hypothetical protein UW03_C0022G0016 [Candidatus Peregrinibacteria bacterium GW2011_GWA2_43_8]HAU39608.1 hypothetical protein [Candidatus Peregrinibacteria bacterium]
MANNPNQNPDKGGVESKIDKLVMGAIIGGAIGSVIGLAVAPDKGEKTRKAIFNKGKEFVSSHKGEISSATTMAKETALGLFRLIRNLTKK